MNSFEWSNSLLAKSNDRLSSFQTLEGDVGAFLDLLSKKQEWQLSTSWVGCSGHRSVEAAMYFRGFDYLHRREYQIPSATICGPFLDRVEKTPRNDQNIGPLGSDDSEYNGTGV